MGNDNFIEFNGKRYDAITGKLLGKSRTEIVEPLAAPVVSVRRNIDGVVRHHDVRRDTMPVAAPQTTAKLDHVKAHRSPPANTAKAHRPQPAKTLMRRAVHKPSTTMKPAIKPQAPAEVTVMAKPISAVALKHSVAQVDPARKHRASQATKSHAVQRFAPHVVHPQLAPVVVPQHHAPKPAVHAPVSAHTKPDIFQAAIARASSHEQPKIRAKHHKGRRTAGILAGLTVLLVLGGVIGYLNINNIKLKVASVQAGFSAQLPSYQPTGYVLGAVTTNSGNVSLNFRSGEKHYQLTQQPTNWNSQTLGDEIIASAGAKTIESHGRIIYIYDNTASWVSGGVRYDLTGNAELDEDDIAAIAASM
jgi:hypothetical protein